MATTAAPALPPQLSASPTTAPATTAPAAADAKAHPPTQPDGQFAAAIRPVLAEYCFACHGNGKHKGDVTLDHFTTVQSIVADRKTWETVADELRQQAMPPEKHPRPDAAQIEQLLTWIDATLGTNLPDKGPRDPGHVTLRRLNRQEYNNTIRDLVGVDFKPANDFPADETGYGFDNIADVLTMSPLLAEKYLRTAELILDKAIPTNDPRKKKRTRYAAAELDQTIKVDGGSASGGTLTATGELHKWHEFPLAGEYEVRIRASGAPVDDEVPKLALKVDDKPVQTYDVKSVAPHFDTFTVKLPLTAGGHHLAAAFVNGSPPAKVAENRKLILLKEAAEEKGDAQAARDAEAKKPTLRKLTIDVLEVEGPFNAASAPAPPAKETQKRLLFVTAGKGVSEEDAAGQIVRRFATRAFRRPASDKEVARLVGLFKQARAGGESFEQAAKITLEAVLVSPYFLFRIEADPAGGEIHPLAATELASRLSYFLWSTMPDDALLQKAADGSLRKPGELEAQVKRMLGDWRSSTLITNFVGQWLELRNLDDFFADSVRFPKFSGKLRSAMKRETEMFFENLIKEDRSVLELLDSDYTFVNATLAKHYGLPNVNGDEFRKVSLAGTKRGGVLTMGSILCVTAMPSRTSPVKRGKFVLEEILGTPPPPPPADVPSFKDQRPDAQTATVRQRFEQHRADPNCAGCHARMDPIGFSMENFDATGAWREKDGKFPVDATGTLPGGKTLNGSDDLKKMLLARKDDFVRTMVEKMLTYAVGRGIEPGDRATVRDICEYVRKNDYRFSSVVMGIVQSDAFQKRRAK